MRGAKLQPGVGDTLQIVLHALLFPLHFLFSFLYDFLSCVFPVISRMLCIRFHNVICAWFIGFIGY